MNIATQPFRTSDRLAAIGVSEILQIGARASAMKKAGHPVIILGAGEPDFDTPDHVKEAATAALVRGETKYTALDGTAELKAAIAAKVRRDAGYEVSPAEISVSTGAKQVIFNALMATVGPGDEVIIPTPFWTSYADIVQMTGATPILVPCHEAHGFLLSPADLEQAITPRSRWLILNSPSNPSGAAYSAECYRALAQVLQAAPQVWLMADDMYEKIRYTDGPFATPAAIMPAFRERILTVNGVSKAWAMTGWRIGWGVGPAPLIQAMAVAQSQSTSCPSSVGQAAAVAALNGPQDFMAGRTEAFRCRRDLVVAGLNAIPGITCRVPDGAFYTFSSCAGLIGLHTSDGRTLASDRDVAAWLLDSAHVAVVPGAAFGLSPYFRISYATSEAELTEALSRIARAVEGLTP